MSLSEYTGEAEATTASADAYNFISTCVYLVIR